MITVDSLRCEYMENPIGLDVKEPRISWKLHSKKPAVMQSACQVQIAKDFLFESIIWDSNKLETSESIQFPINQIDIQPFTRYYYRVKVWDQDGEVSDWSNMAFWETGIFGHENWRAKWIKADDAIERSDAIPYFRKVFSTNQPIKKARIYATSLGLYELHMNGERVGEDYFTPGWTSYHKRLQYQAYDVTHLLNNGKNAVGFTLGNGWYKGVFGFEGRKNIYGDTKAGLLELHIEYENGEKECILTDDTWKVATGPITYSEIYHGETYDARLEEKNWCTSHDVGWIWHDAEVLSYRKDMIIHQENNPVKKTNILKPIELIHTPEGDTVIDMGQNMVGWVQFKVKGYRGQEISLLHAEILDKDGNFYTGNLRTAKQKITYILNGDENGEEFEPHFSFQGFRYVKVIGIEDTLDLDDFTGVVLHTDMDETGMFECSNPLINQLHHNILWGLKGNFLDVPTDCPQRDERLGWTGDAQMFIRTASYLTNVAPFFTKWIRDLSADQLEHGGVPYVIPDIIEKTSWNLGHVTHSVAAWGDAAVIIPWTLYTCYGDERILKEQYSSMKGWVEYIRGRGNTEELWDSDFQLGDWLALDSEPDTYSGITNHTFLATAYYAYSTDLLIRTAKVLGYEQDVKEYEELYEKIVQAFRNEFVHDNGRLTEQTQTANVLALQFNLVKEEHRPIVARDLRELIRQRNDHLTTGFIGTPYLNHVLSQNGYHDVACTLLLQEDYPSWLYQITKGATTVWEHWDGIKEDGSFWSDNMNSFNHYAYGSIGEWLYKVIAGIDLQESAPGYKHIVLNPKLGAELTWVKCKYETLYGEIQSNWQIEDDEVVYHFIIPANTTATITLPHLREQFNLTECELQVGNGILDLYETKEDVSLEVGSGEFIFRVKM